MTVLVSVVVPAYNCRDLVQKAIFSLQSQTLPMAQYEVIVADDGSEDGTQDLVTSMQMGFPLHYVRQQNRGRAAARNLGARQAQGEWLLFLDADMEASPALLEMHMGAHRRHPDVLVMGQVLLAPSAAQSQFAKMAESGRLATGKQRFMSALQCATGNLSLLREAYHRLGGFDERFRFYGWEDTDLGYRAASEGLGLLYDPSAISYHHDYAVDLALAANRARQAARSVWILFDKHPELQGKLNMFEDKGYLSWGQDPARIVLRKLARGLMILPPILNALEGITRAVEEICPSPALLRPLYRWVLGAYLCLGYREGMRERHG